MTGGAQGGAGCRSDLDTPQLQYLQMLTEKELKNAKPRDKPFKLAAGGGFIYS